MSRAIWAVVGVAAALSFGPGRLHAAGRPAPPAVDATTLKHKVLCGYQGWFRCPGDPAGERLAALEPGLPRSSPRPP